MPILPRKWVCCLRRERSTVAHAASPTLVAVGTIAADDRDTTVIGTTPRDLVFRYELVFTGAGAVSLGTRCVRMLAR